MLSLFSSRLMTLTSSAAVLCQETFSDFLDSYSGSGMCRICVARRRDLADARAKKRAWGWVFSCG